MTQSTAKRLVTEAALGDRFLDALTFGAAGDGTTDDTTAITELLAAAKSAGRVLYLPAGVYKITSDLVIDWDYGGIKGEGACTVLNMVGSKIKVDGSSAYRQRTTLRDFRVNRSGSAGPALLLQGGAGATGPARFDIDNVDIKGSTGDGLEAQGAIVGTIIGSYFRECTGRGVYLHDATNHSNAITFHGGEIEGNTGGGVQLLNAGGISFHGTCIETNTAFGAKVDAAVGVGFYGCFFQANVTDDILVGNATTVSGFVLSGSYLVEGSQGKTDSIRLLRATGVDIRGNGFQGYGANSPILVNEATSGAVKGAAPEDGNFRDGTAATLVLLTASTAFSKTLRASATIAYTAIAAGAIQDHTITVTGAQVGDDVTVNQTAATAVESGIVMQAWVSAANTVTVRLINASTGSITPASRAYQVRVTR